MRIETLSQSVQPTGCQDIALLPNGLTEGPISIVCDMSENVGMISKCCPKGSILDSTLRNCVPWQDSSGLLPNRMVRDPLTGMATGHYHLKISKEDFLHNGCLPSQETVFR